MNPSLVMVQPRKTRPFITERLMMGRKESNQTNKQKKQHNLINVCNLTACYLYQVMMTLHFLNDVANDA